MPVEKCGKEKGHKEPPEKGTLGLETGDESTWASGWPELGIVLLFCREWLVTGRTFWAEGTGGFIEGARGTVWSSNEHRVGEGG